MIKTYKSLLKSGILSLLLFLVSTGSSWAQCAMCRASVESSVSSGGDLVAGLNAGILYLAAIPYLALALLFFGWYKHAKRTYGKANKISGYSRG